MSTCITKGGSTKPARISTTSYSTTITSTAVVSITYTPVTTSSLYPATTTTTSTLLRSTTTILPATTTNTFTSTTTIIVPVTTRPIVTQTVTVTATTTTTVTPTTTIEPSLGFIPADPAYPAKRAKRTPRPKIERSRLTDQLAADDIAKRVYPIPTRDVLQPRLLDPKSTITTYATAVTCGYLIEVTTTRTSVVTTKTSTVVPPRSTVTVPTYTTRTITYTVMPLPASTTKIVSSTITTTSTLAASTITATTTSTSTVTVNEPAATFYAACAPNNVYNGTQDGRPINEYDFNGGGDFGFFSYFDSPSPYDCCVYCQTRSDIGSCGGAFFQYNDANMADGGSCIALYAGDGACNGQTNVIAEYFTFEDYDTKDVFSASNGPCGQVVFNPVPPEKRKA